MLSALKKEAVYISETSEILLTSDEIKYLELNQYQVGITNEAILFIS